MYNTQHYMHKDIALTYSPMHITEPFFPLFKEKIVRDVYVMQVKTIPQIHTPDCGSEVVIFFMEHKSLHSLSLWHFMCRYHRECKAVGYIRLHSAGG